MDKRTFLKNTTTLGLASLVNFKAFMIEALTHLPTEAVVGGKTSAQLSSLKTKNYLKLPFL
jgi:hypothetical protein